MMPRRSMSPAEFAEQQCANHVGNICIITEAPCALTLDKPARCTHFETCLLPLAEKPELRNFKLFRTAAAAYRRTHGLKSGSPCSGRECDCGEPLLPRQRVCGKCRVRRRRETYRLAARKRRLPVNS